MKYRQKPVVVDAMLFTGANASEMSAWSTHLSTRGGNLEMQDANGTYHVVESGTWVILERDDRGAYPCPADIFEATYDPVED